MTGHCYCDTILDRYPVRNSIKAAALKVSPSVVYVVTYNVPDSMLLLSDNMLQIGSRDDGTYACPGSGVVIQCKVEEDGTYSSIILAPAHLFKRTNDIHPKDVPVDVRVSGGKLFKGELLACDFHYNLAAIRIQSNSPLKPATISHLSDATLTDVDSNQHLQSNGEKRKRPSICNSFNVKSGTELLTAKRSWVRNYEIDISTCVFRACEMPRKELLSIKGSDLELSGGGAVLNYNGEVIGICVRNGSFLPFNLVSRWWAHFESCREYRRPYLGVEVANQFVKKIPNSETGVVVTRVEENSPAHRLGIKRDDVIIKCDGFSICSKLELFERVWDSNGQVVELNVLKSGDGDGVESDLNITIEDTPQDKLYEWDFPRWSRIPKRIRPF